MSRLMPLISLVNSDSFRDVIIVRGDICIRSSRNDFREFISRGIPPRLLWLCSIGILIAAVFDVLFSAPRDSLMHTRYGSIFDFPRARARTLTARRQHHQRWLLNSLNGEVVKFANVEYNRRLKQKATAMNAPMLEINWREIIHHQSTRLFTTIRYALVPERLLCLVGVAAIRKSTLVDFTIKSRFYCIDNKAR